MLPHGQPPPLPPPSAGKTLLWFFVGLIAGTALSAIVWVGGFKSMDSTFASGAILIIPAVKLTTGIIFLCRRGWRSLGAGILVSLALGFLIFFGVCAMHLGDMH
ncbi:MAG TPA: hypothetical protein VFC46_10360 [Humisphaera sp.]|nr:hypothetical protein [Humisphaera sp.]